MLEILSFAGVSIYETLFAMDKFFESFFVMEYVVRSEDV